MLEKNFIGAVVLRFHSRNKRGFGSFRLEPLRNDDNNKDKSNEKKEDFLIDSAPQSSLVSFMELLTSEGFALKDFFRREDSSQHNIRHVAEFCLVRAVCVNTGIWKQEYHHTALSMELALKTLKWFVSESLWNARVDSRPWKNKAEFLHINLNSRLPLVLPNGEPAKEWLRDDHGKKVGEHPVPINPKNDLGDLLFGG